jgi:cytolysin-activating lysine-acyltransferase
MQPFSRILHARAKYRFLPSKFSIDFSIYRACKDLPQFVAVLCYGPFLSMQEIYPMSTSQQNEQPGNDKQQPGPAASAAASFQNINDKLKANIPAQPNARDNDSQLKDRTMGRMLGEIVWLMSQSPAHKHFALADLEWMVMPPLALGQYRIFRNGEQPVGVALWAHLSEESEKKLEAGATRLMPQEWAPDIRIDAENGMTAGEGGSLWLIDLICPAQTSQNKLADICLHDLMTSVFSGKRFKMFRGHEDGRREVVSLLG